MSEFVGPTRQFWLIVYQIDSLVTYDFNSNEIMDYCFQSSFGFIPSEGDDSIDELC
jgi:hypothetical protein